MIGARLAASGRNDGAEASPRRSVTMYVIVSDARRASSEAPGEKATDRLSTA
jgi:hypothetical protein